MKKTLSFVTLAMLASFASADITISHSNTPAGTGNWHFNMITSGSSTRWGGFLNPVQSFGGNVNISPIERLGFYWRNNSSPWLPVGNSSWDTLWSEDSGFGAGLTKQVTFRSKKFNGTGNVLEYQVIANLVPIAGPATTFPTTDVATPLNSKAYVVYTVNIKNLTGTATTTDFAVLGDLASRNMTPSSLNLNDQDTFTTNAAVGANKATSIFSRVGCPTYYFKSSNLTLSGYEANKDVTPPIRTKLSGGADNANLTNSVGSPSAGNWAVGYSYALTIPANGTVSGQVILGYNVNPTQVQGTVTLNDLFDAVSSTPGQVVAYEIRNVGSSTALASGSTTLGAGGAYSITTTLAAGNYDLALKGSHWNRKVVSLALGLEGASAVNAALDNGDVDGDNEVSILDYIKLSSNYGKTSSDSDWNTPDGDNVKPRSSDLDEDGEVSILDYIVLSTNYGLSGDN